MSAVALSNSQTLSGTVSALRRAGAPWRRRLINCSTPMIVADVIRHREDQQRLGQIAVLLIEAAVDLVLGVGGDVVRVVDHQRFAGHGHVARKALARDREDLFLEGLDVDRIVLGQLPAEDLPSAHRVEEVERSRIGARELAGFAQDHGQQHGVIAHGRQRRADIGYLL